MHGHVHKNILRVVSLHRYVLTHFGGARTKFVSALTVSEFKLAKLLKMRLYLTKLVDKKYKRDLPEKEVSIVTF